MTKKENVTAFFEKMKREEAQAHIDYKRIMEEDKNKNFMDVLPADFKQTKRSIIKRQILKYLEITTNFLNKCSLYDGRKFDKKEVVRYMMRGTAYSNFYLAHLFIPRRDTTGLWMDYAYKHRSLNNGKKLDGLYKKFEAENKDILKEYEELSTNLQWLKQVWEQYEDMQKIRRKDPEAIDMEKDGYPRTGRGNMCVAFVPVKGKFPVNQKGLFTLFNPRTKKSIKYHILGYKKEDNIYKCSTPTGKEVFLADYQSIADSWDALFSSNKEVYSGWWNRIMILK